MLRCVTDARAVEEEVVVAARDELERTASMKLDHRICPTGEAVVDFSGELDFTTAEAAVESPPADFESLFHVHYPRIAGVIALA